MLKVNNQKKCLKWGGYRYMGGGVANSCLHLNSGATSGYCCAQMDIVGSLYWAASAQDSQVGALEGFCDPEREQLEIFSLSLSLYYSEVVHLEVFATQNKISWNII